MLKDSYETTVGSSYNISAILSELDRALIENVIFSSTLPDNTAVDNLMLIIGDNVSLPPFNHPISHKDMVFVDVRGLVKNDPMTKLGYKVTSATNFKLCILRARIQLLAMANSPRYLNNIHPLPTIVYGRFISEGITYKLGLNPEDQMVLSALSTAYYINQFDDSNDGSSQDMSALQISRYTNISPEFIINEVLADIGELDTLDQLLSAISEKVTNSRINQLNTGLFFTALTYGWKGLNSKEIMAVSIEYPPTWMAMVATAITERLQKDSPIARMVRTYGKKDMDKDFVLGLTRAISE